jgi:hypothetical protein
MEKANRKSLLQRLLWHFGDPGINPPRPDGKPNVVEPHERVVALERGLCLESPGFNRTVLHLYVIANKHDTCVAGVSAFIVGSGTASCLPTSIERFTRTRCGWPLSIV